MQSSSSLARRFQNKRFRWLFIAAVCIVCIAIAVPLGVVYGTRNMGNKHSKHGKPQVLLPLYIYPDPGAWDAVYKAAETYPKLKFTVVVNPHNGPGAGELPDANYTREITKLNTYDNIRTLGYVATTWAGKDVSAARSEIAVYEGWAAQNKNLTMHGIFFDETPTQYTDENVRYLRDVTRAVRTAKGLAGTFVVHNPGAQPDIRLIDIPDVTIIFEQTYRTWIERDSPKELSDFSSHANKVCVVMHSVPDADNDNKFLNQLVSSIHNLATYIYITGSSNYTDLSSHFTDFVSHLT